MRRDKASKKRKLRPLKNRGIRVLDYSTLYPTDDDRARWEQLLAGLSIDSVHVSALLARIDFAVRHYKDSAITRDQYPRTGEQRGELELLLNYTQSFEQALTCLSQTSRLLILDAASGWTHELVDTFKLQGTIRQLSTQIRVALLRLPEQSRGRAPDDDMTNLLFGLSVAWFAAYPDKKGVTKSEDSYSGQLVIFVSSVLRLAEIKVQSTLGKRLYKLRQVAIDRAREEIERRKQRESGGSETPSAKT